MFSGAIMNFGVTIGHVTVLIPHIRFPTGALLEPTPQRIKAQMHWVTTLTFRGHLTSSVTYVTIPIPLALCDFL